MPYLFAFRALLVSLCLLAGSFTSPAQPTTPAQPAAPTGTPLTLPADVPVYDIPSTAARPHRLDSRRVVVVQEGLEWLKVVLDDQKTKCYLYRAALQLKPGESVADFVARGGEALPSAAAAAAASQRVAEARSYDFPVDSATGRIVYTDVVSVPGVSQADLYARAFEWMAKVYNSSKSVIELNDREAGKIIGKGAIPVRLKGSKVTNSAGVVGYTVSVFCKEGRYKYVLTDFHHEQVVSPSMATVRLRDTKLEIAEPEGLSATTWHYILEQASAEARQLVTELKTAMGRKADSDF